MFGKATYLRSASLAVISALPVILGAAQANADPLLFDFSFSSGRGSVAGVKHKASLRSPADRERQDSRDFLPIGMAV